MKFALFENIYHTNFLKYDIFEIEKQYNVCSLNIWIGIVQYSTLTVSSIVPIPIILRSYIVFNRFVDRYILCWRFCRLLHAVNNTKYEYEANLVLIPLFIRLD